MLIANKDPFYFVNTRTNAFRSAAPIVEFSNPFLMRLILYYTDHGQRSTRPIP